MDPILTKQRIAITPVGEIVELRIGNSTITFDHETALKLANWLRIAGKRAKLVAGDHSRSYHAVALLTDAEQDDKLGIRGKQP